MAGAAPAAVERDHVDAVQPTTSSGNDVRQAIAIHVSDRHGCGAAPFGAEVTRRREVARPIVDIDGTLRTVDGRR